jgi:hypothetical protein
MAATLKFTVFWDVTRCDAFLPEHMTVIAKFQLRLFEI